MFKDKFKNRIIPGDGIANMGLLEDRCIDLLLTDIPYDVVNREGGIRVMDKGKADIITFSLETLVAEATRVVNGSAVIFCSTEQAGELVALFERSGEWEDVVHGFWVKNNPSPVHGEMFFLNATESFIAARKPGAYFNPAKVGKPAVYACNIGTSKVHPTEKPDALFTEIVKDYTKKRDWVLDPCCGSGKTAFVSAQHERFFTCFELDETFCEKATARLTGVLQNFGLLVQENYILSQVSEEKPESVSAKVGANAKTLSIVDGLTFLRKTDSANLLLTDISAPEGKPVSMGDEMDSLFEEITRVVKGSAVIYCDSLQAHFLRDKMDKSDEWKFVRHGVSTGSVNGTDSGMTGHALTPKHFIAAKKSGAYFSALGFCKRPVFSGTPDSVGCIAESDLVKIIEATTVAGDVVIDPFSGGECVQEAAKKAVDGISGLHGHRVCKSLSRGQEWLVEQVVSGCLPENADKVEAAQRQVNSKEARAKRAMQEKEERKRSKVKKGRQANMLGMLGSDLVSNG